MVDATTSIHHLHDGPSGMRYLVLRGQDTAGLAERIERMCSTRTFTVTDAPAA